MHFIRFYEVKGGALNREAIYKEHDCGYTYPTISCMQMLLLLLLPDSKVVPKMSLRRYSPDRYSNIVGTVQVCTSTLLFLERTAAQ